MAGFNFGGSSTPTVPAAAAVPVPAAANNSSAGGGSLFGNSGAGGGTNVGFSFGGSNSTGSTAAAPAVANPNTTGSNANGTTNTHTAAPLLSLTSASASASATTTLTIPCCDEAFPNLGIHAEIESILEAINDPSISHTDLTLQGQQLIHLLANAATNTDTHTDTNTNTNTNHANAMEQCGHILAHPQPLPSQPQNSNQNYNSNHTMIQLPNSNKPTPLPASLSNTLNNISQKLNITPNHAAALYGACILDTLDEATLGKKTKAWFHKRHSKPSFMAGFTLSSLQKHAPDLHLHQHQYQQHQQQQQHHHQQQNDSQQMEHMAMDLYFLEKGYTLSTLDMLIQHRISISTSLENNNIGTPSALESVVIQATNQLLEGGLVTNLVNLVRELTTKNEQLKHTICHAGTASNSNTNTNPSFNSFQHPSISIHTTANPMHGGAAAAVTDADYAMYEFTIQQRQLASRCLFYLAYHTQLNMEEVTGLMDLIQDLTNGDGHGDGHGGSALELKLGSGLMILDPLRDVPDPYEVAWNNHSSEHGGGAGDGNVSGNASGNGSAGGMAMSSSASMQMNNASMTPQQTKTVKKHEEWKQELVDSLWSVRGLANATVTTTHVDFSGQQLYHAMTLKDSSNVGNQNGNGNGGVVAAAVAVAGGKPQLMQTVSSLILACMCALDGKNVLIGRHSQHGTMMKCKNALLPLEDSMEIVNQCAKPLSDRLDPNGAGFANWKRQDIVGLLSAAFALLLRPAVDVMASPGKGGGGLAVLKETVRSCLESPTIAKSMTFARVSLMPCLGSASMQSSSPTLDNDFAFYMSIVSDFTAQYLDAICSFGDLPISSQKWMDQEKEELRIRHVQEMQKKQLEEWSGKAYTEAKLPKEVDITKRPDCLDDIIALAVSICSSCPECSSRFWMATSTDDEGDGNLIYNIKPSMVMKKLEKAQAKDSSLLPIYASFLSALTLTNDPNEIPIGNDGASVIYEWLSDSDRLKSSPTSYDATKQVNWRYILYSIQFYTEQLNPPAAEKSQAVWGVTDQYQKSPSYDVDSTAYYYGADDNSTRFTSNSQTRSADSSSSGPGAGDKKKELDERSTMILSSFLSLLSQVALKSEESRLKLLGIRLNSSDNQRSLSPEDDAITILFELLVTSISPEMRGLALTTIANLVRQPPNNNLSKEETEKGDDNVLKCWELLEASQILPIAKLGQYSPLQNTGIPSYTRSKTPAEQSNWFPPNEHNGIIYEIEYVESKNGSYPSTEGLLKLLAALFSSDVYPSNLGASWRPQQGCTPYMEYVTDFVLPRALNSKNEAGLYFASPADKSRLVTRALEVVDVVLARYVPTKPSLPRNASAPTLVSESRATTQSNALIYVPDAAKFNGQEKTEEGCDMASSGPLSLVASFICPKNVNSAQRRIQGLDYTNEVVQIVPEPNDMNNQATPQSIPRPKSPGYVVLSEMLSSTGCLFELVTQLLVEESGTKSASNDAYPVALSLFGETIPSFQTAKAGRDYILDEHKSDVSQLSLDILDSTYRQLFIQSLLPDNAEDVNENSLANNAKVMATRNDTLFWKECCILLSLKILCASAARDATFAACNSLNDSLVIVPVMQFQSREVGFNNPLLIKNFQLTHLSKKLIETSFDPGMNSAGEFFLTILSQYIGYQASSLNSGNIIGLMAMGLVKYLSNSSSSRDFSRSMCGLQPSSQAATASSVSSRLALVPLLKENENECLLCDEILSLILHNLKQVGIGKQNLAHVMLGLSEQTLEEQRQYLLKSMQGIDVDICQYNNVFDTILELVSNVDFILDPKTSALATKCFEIIHHLCEWSEDSNMIVTKLCIMNKLRKSNFWQLQLVRFLGSTSGSDCLLKMILSHSPINGQSFQDEDDLAIIERDSNVLHCVAWLLKGVAFELHSLMGGVNGIDNVGLVGKFPTSSPQPQQCRQLLELLLSDGTQVLFNALENLPLTKPLHLTEELLLNKPSNETINLASCAMNGPNDVYDGFTIVDATRLRKALCDANTNGGRLSSEELEKQQVSANIWARAWNSYLHFVCASSHISRAWSFLTSAVFSSCKSLLLTDYNYNNSSAYDGRSALVLFKSILGRFCENGGSNSSSGRLDEFALYSLSNASIPLVETILELHQMTSDETGISVGEEDMFYVIEMLIDTIVSCASGDNHSCEGVKEETAVIFATILSAVLESNLVRTNGRLQNLSARVNFGERAMKACLVLTKLCLRDKNHNEDILSLCDAARSGLASLLKWFDHLYEQDEENVHSSFLFQLYAAQSSISSPLTQLVDQILLCDHDITNLLETIACCNGGTDLLVEAGVTKALISISQECAKDFSSRSRNTYGNVMPRYPQYIFGHVSLLNTMLASEFSEYTHERLIFDAAEFVQVHAGTIEVLFGQFPGNEELLFDFLTTIALVGSSAKNGGKVQMEQLFDGTILSMLDQRMLDLAMHVLEFPFPENSLPSLPGNLRGPVRQQGGVQSWWNSIPTDSSTIVDSDMDALVLPQPPCGNSMRLSTMNNRGTQWTVRMYRYACAATNCLDVCLTHIMHRPSLQTDMSSLAVALYRSTETICAIVERLETLTASNDDAIVDMMTFTKINSTPSNDVATMRLARRKEIESLQMLGVSLASCVAKLLQVIKSCTDVTLRALRDGSCSIPYRDLQVSSRYLLNALNISQIERAVGCVDILQDELSLSNVLLSMASESIAALNVISR